jgi:hypothetical protein
VAKPSAKPGHPQDNEFNFHASSLVFFYEKKISVEPYILQTGQKAGTANTVAKLHCYP